MAHIRVTRICFYKSLALQCKGFVPVESRMPCKPNTANRHIERHIYIFFAKFIRVLTALCIMIVKQRKYTRACRLLSIFQPAQLSPPTMCFYERFNNDDDDDGNLQWHFCKVVLHPLFSDRIEIE